MPLPDIKGPDRDKPLTYDPQRHKFITFDELVSGQEPAVPIESLSRDDLKKLILERQRLSPPYRVMDLNGNLMTREDVIRAIETDSDFGRLTLEAEASHLSDLLEQIRTSVPPHGRVPQKS